MLSTLAGALLITGVWGHGRLTKPMTRIGSETAYENDPIGFGGRPANQFICRHDSPNASVEPTQVNAGGKLDLNWRTTAAHVGDCAFYLSYDVDKDMEDMRWFKIGNMQQCKDHQLKDNPIDLPNWLPEGKAVLRWEWYALHVFPTIEFYTQCSDLYVNPTADAISVDNIPTFKVWANGAKISLPENGEDGVGFRNPFSGSNQEMTGPECALGSTLNNCGLTAEGTARHVDVNAEVVTPIEVPTSEPAPTPTPPPTEEMPAPAPTMEPVESPTNPPVESPSPPVVSPTAPPQDVCASGSLYAHYAQCDGDGFQKLSGDCQACPTGFQCYKRNNWYSNCNHSCPQGLGWECDNAAPVVAPTQPPVEAPVASPTQPPVADGDCPNGEHDTCGGEGQNVPTCCPSGMTCTAYSKWHSQCVKDQ